MFLTSLRSLASGDTAPPLVEGDREEGEVLAQQVLV